MVISFALGYNVLLLYTCSSPASGSNVLDCDYRRRSDLCLFYALWNKKYPAFPSWRLQLTPLSFPWELLVNATLAVLENILFICVELEHVYGWVGWVGLCFGRGCVHLIFYYIHTYIYTFINGSWAPSLTIACQHWNPVRDLGISARFMAPGHETPRARQGGAPRARGRSPRPSGDACTEPLRLEGSPEYIHAMNTSKQYLYLVSLSRQMMHIYGTLQVLLILL